MASNSINKEKLITLAKNVVLNAKLIPDPSM